MDLVSAMRGFGFGSWFMCFHPDTLEGMKGKARREEGVSTIFVIK